MNFWLVLKTWGPVLGLMTDIVGATLVYLGVRTTILRAFVLERQVVQKTVDDIGSPELAEKGAKFNADRARERVRASRLAWYGLICFVIGFSLQAFGHWPVAR